MESVAYILILALALGVLFFAITLAAKGCQQRSQNLCISRL
ncbi:MAG: photosystem II reaction center protein T [Oscillatoriales cyanobacterium]|nr:MAG: photosystem II reaction center protein T [Oscillatoriales cyanobacterium]